MYSTIAGVTILALLHSNAFAQSDTKCTAPGPMCDSCNQVVICVNDEDGFHKLPVETCTNDQTCLAAQCTSDRNPKCEEDLDFICNDIGVFPDPYDCQTYHFCVPDSNGDLLNYKVACDGSYGYHAGTTFCQTRLQNNICSQYINEFPVDLCLTSGQTGSLLENPSIYYICAQYSDTVEILYPFLYVCPHGGKYNNFECIPLFKKNYSKLMNRF